MQSEKISISLPSPLLQFIENYKLTKGCKSRSEVIELAIELLRYQELERAYQEAATEINSEWDVTVGDGLSDETW
ncbi:MULTISPECIES: ribbon-helix-helix domain-containing protein [Sphaerospermopsis]|jgi:antitoxin ParD1/3/4|uniref:Ribbon-helix-helix domain-containing protein n=1 Tax=Sphaerospermopsis torques-reginae ITEP-024 TaxID=984208 RepID=A0ABX8X219_9CYAN|nr:MULTISPECIES: ribbon-helix-helix domain-containing protein [Sphaerospermopsis]MBE9058726.1 CopG family transcriptional regulator [Sphaerospermopsis sp. LEGE 08334]QYX32751.1 ribbon-helix-helix domain-containing protein [Sphaerospermopsis torques-reginae ITEP-024]